MYIFNFERIDHIILCFFSQFLNQLKKMKKILIIVLVTSAVKIISCYISKKANMYQLKLIAHFHIGYPHTKM